MMNTKSIRQNTVYKHILSNLDNMSIDGWTMYFSSLYNINKLKKVSSPINILIQKLIINK